MKKQHTFRLCFVHLCLLYRPLNTYNEPTCIWNCPGEEINKGRDSSQRSAHATAARHGPFAKNSFPSTLPLRRVNITEMVARRHTASHEDHRTVVGE